MNPTEIIQELYELEAAYKEKAHALHLSFLHYLTDKNHPIHERWRAFLNAPDSLMDEETFIMDIPDVFDAVWERRREDVYKYECVHLSDFLDEVLDENGNIHTDYDEYSPEEVYDALEGLMKNGVNRFIFDW